jgi:glutamate-5-semialdehyde dehydrogenase
VGTLDRLRLDRGRIEDARRQIAAVAALPPLERTVAAWTLENGLHVSEHRIPIGVVGANFEARPAVALDIASQLLKSLNAAVLRTGSAALETVTTLVERVIRPALEVAGIPGGAVGLVADTGHTGAYALVSQPDLIPVVILRGSGETTAGLTRLASTHGVHTIAHAEGGGVLYVDRAANPETAFSLVRASLDRLGVCNRLNLLLIHEEVADMLPELVQVVDELEIVVRGTERAQEITSLAPLTNQLGHEWADDAQFVSSISVEIVSSLQQACMLANRETSGLAAGIVTEDAAAAEQFFSRYRGTAVFWHASTRFTDGFALLGVPETGIKVGAAPGPRGPVTYRDLWLRQLRVVGDGMQTR